MHLSLRETVEKFATSTLLTLGLILSAGIAKANPVESTTSIPDGRYLYGESAQPDQIGQAYLVFEAVDGQVQGAFYMPHSSFDCFSGDLSNQALHLTLVDSYDRTTWDYSIPVDRQAVVASADTVQLPMLLQGYHQISTLSDNDARILDTCRAQ